jgi:hypothetical protein
MLEEHTAQLRFNRVSSHFLPCRLFHCFTTKLLDTHALGQNNRVIWTYTGIADVCRILLSLFNDGHHFVHVEWVHCYHGMARPQVAHGGDALQIWRVPANILNKQSPTDDKGCSSFGLGVGLTTFHRIN